MKDSKTRFLNAILVARKLAEDVACYCDEKSCYYLLATLMLNDAERQ